MEKQLKKQSPKHDYSKSLHVMQVLDIWSRKYQYDSEDLYIALKSARSLTLAEAFRPLERVKLDSIFIKDAEDALSNLKEFRTFDYEFVNHRLERCREMDKEFNGKPYDRVFPEGY